jgi:hypothetical protein
MWLAYTYVKRNSQHDYDAIKGGENLAHNHPC